MDLAAIVYLSHACRLFSSDEIEALLKGARDFNQRCGVTGVLLYGDGSFFQYIEGERQQLDQVYLRIKQSTAHFGLLEIMNGPIDRREFNDWHMGFRHSPRTELKQLAQARWMATLDNLRRSSAPSMGVTMLVDYWEKAPNLLA